MLGLDAGGVRQKPPLIFLVYSDEGWSVFFISQAGVQDLQGRWSVYIPEACGDRSSNLYSASKGNKRTKAESPGCRGLWCIIFFRVFVLSRLSAETKVEV